MERLRADFPGVSFFHSVGIWYATGLCVCRDSRHSRTLHARTVQALRGQLGDAAEGHPDPLPLHATEAGTVL